MDPEVPQSRIQQLWIHHKKLSIITAIAAVFFLVSVLGFISTQFISNQQQTSPVSTSEEQGNTHTSVTTTPSHTTNSQGWITQKQEDYSVSFPSDLSPLGSEDEGGLEKFTVYNKKDPTFSIAIESVTPDQPITFKNKVATIFRSYGFTESATTIDGLPAMAFTGTLKTGEKSKQQMAVLFQTPTHVYQILLSYTADKRNPEYDAMFSQMITTFALHK